VALGQQTPITESALAPSATCFVANLTHMASIQDGIVYLSLGIDYWADDDKSARWSGSCQFADDQPFEHGPEFDDANEAVMWWRERGARRICIRLDDRETLWAGDGPPPQETPAMSVFDPEDPRGRPEGASKTISETQQAQREQEEAEKARASIEEGRLLAWRRDYINLSIEELANRVAQSPRWIREVESGATSESVTMSQWIELVWATRDPYPDERRSSTEEMKVSWAAAKGHYLAEAELIVNAMLGCYD
jgi:hypothetical protein